MEKTRVRKLMKKMTSVICVIAIYMTNSERIYARQWHRPQRSAESDTD